jgi:hypothetical protein
MSTSLPVRNSNLDQPLTSEESGMLEAFAKKIRNEGEYAAQGGISGLVKRVMAYPAYRRNMREALGKNAGQVQILDILKYLVRVKEWDAVTAALGTPLGAPPSESWFPITRVLLKSERENNFRQEVLDRLPDGAQKKLENMRYNVPTGPEDAYTEQFDVYGNSHGTWS